MIAILKNAIFVSGSTREFTNNETGEVRSYSKALFTQEGQDPVQLNIESDVLDGLEMLCPYDLELNITNFDRKFYVRVVAANAC